MTGARAAARPYDRSASTRVESVASFLLDRNAARRALTRGRPELEVRRIGRPAQAGQRLAAVIVRAAAVGKMAARQPFEQSAAVREPASGRRTRSLLVGAIAVLGDRTAAKCARRQQ